MASNSEELNRLCAKYHMEIVDGLRYYTLNLGDPSFDSSNVSPYSLNIGNKIFTENKWTKLLLALFEYLDNHEHKTNDELLIIKVPHSKRVIFSTGEKGSSGCTEVRPGLYFHNGVDASFAGLTIIYLLLAYHFDLNDCELCVRYAGYFEPDEVTDYFTNINKEKFVDYLTGLGIRSLNSENIERVISFIDSLTEEYSTHYYVCNSKLKNLFSFDSYDVFCECKDAIAHDLETNTACAGLFLEIDFGPIDDDNILSGEDSNNGSESERENESKKAVEEAKYKEDNGKKVLNLLDGFYSLEEELKYLDY